MTPGNNDPEEPFGGRSDSVGVQQDLFKFLSQETRHKIIQRILGHPDHLISMTELTYMTSEAEDAIRQQLDILLEADLIDVYEQPENADVRERPVEFYGFTEYGVRILDQYNYLAGLGAERALYDKTSKSEIVQRHQEAPRPALPDIVNTALTFEDSI